MIKKLSHVGVAVRDLDSSVKLFSKLFQVSDIPRETVGDQRVSIGFFHLGGASVELTGATTPDSPIARYIEQRGEGVHHLSFEVDDIRAEIARLKSEGFRMIDEEPRLGAGGYWIAFIHPKSTNGVLIEISQKVNNGQ